MHQGKLGFCKLMKLMCKYGATSDAAQIINLCPLMNQTKRSITLNEIASVPVGNWLVIQVIYVDIKCFHSGDSRVVCFIKTQ